MLECCHGVSWPSGQDRAPPVYLRFCQSQTGGEPTVSMAGLACSCGALGNNSCSLGDVDGANVSSSAGHRVHRHWHHKALRPKACVKCGVPSLSNNDPQAAS